MTTTDPAHPPVDPPADPSPAAPAAATVRRSHRARWIAVAVGVPVALLLVVLATRPPAGVRAADSPLLGKPAPSLKGTTVDGQRFDVAASPGRWVLVNFFATWCVPCRQEHPDLVRFAQQHRLAGDLEVVGVVYDDSAGAVREFREDEGGDWPLLEDPDGRIALDFGVAGVPESYLIDPTGTVAAKVVGGVRAGALDELLARLKSGVPAR